MADAWKAWGSAHRLTEQPMNDFIAMLRRTKLELVTQDQSSYISDEAFTTIADMPKETGIAISNRSWFTDLISHSRQNSSVAR